MFNWQTFVYAPMQPFSQQIPIFTISNFVPVGQEFSITEITENFTNSENGFVENQEKLLLTVEDLKNQSYDTNKKAWSQEEDKKLQYMYERKKLSWEKIAKKIPGRNKKMCYSRYRRLQSGTKIQWTLQDNFKLKSLVSQHGQNWNLISENFKNRNPKQIKQHYKNYARPDIDNSQWCIEDDLKLIQLINQYGKNWKLIEAEMFHRSLNQIKNRFFGKLKKLNASLYGQKLTD